MNPSALLLLLFTAAVQADVVPDEVSVMVRSAHFGGSDKLRSDTPGLALSWKTPALGDRVSFDLAAYRNSQGFGSAYIGLAKEFHISGPLSLGVGAGALYGYRELEWKVIKATCYGPSICVTRGYGTPHWMVGADLRARVQLADGYSVGLTFVPARVLAKAFKADDGKTANALSLWVRKEWK